MSRIMWHLDVPQRLDEMLEDYLKRGIYETKAEFIRTAVREKLLQMVEVERRMNLIRGGEKVS